MNFGGKQYMANPPFNSMANTRPRLLLEIELVPSSSWYENLRKKISKEKWDRLRRKVYAKYGHRCGICGADGRANCHELWSFDEGKRIQKLEGFISLCDVCHNVKHIGLAGIMASEGKLDYEEVVRHFMKVNGCSRQLFEMHRKKAFEIWKKRSKRHWEVVVGDFEKMADEKPENEKQSKLDAF